MIYMFVRRWKAVIYCKIAWYNKALVIIDKLMANEKLYFNLYYIKQVWLDLLHFLFFRVRLDGKVIKDVIPSF